MRAQLSAMRSEEDGFTLVEMLVAILLLAIILSAMVSVIITSLTSMQREEQRVRATQLAQEELERIRAIEWDCAAIDSTDPDYSPTYGGNTTVVLDPTECSDTSIAPDPSPTVRAVDGIDYTVTRNVYWIDDPADGTAAAGTDSEPQDYKEFRADIGWTFRGEAYTYANTSTRVPTVEEVPLDSPPPSATFEITSLEVDPVSVGTSSGATTSTITVIVETSQAASSVNLTVASPSTFGTQAFSDISSGAGVRWQKTIPAGSTAFPNGDHEFVVDATGSLGSDSETETVTFAEAPAVTPVTIKNPVLSPGEPLCVGGSSLHQAVTITVDVDGVSTSDDADLSWTDKTGGATMSPVVATANGAQFTATIPAGTQFNRTTTTLTIDARRIADNTVAQATFSVPVQKHNDPADCP
ncbi:MAG: prepilin-type N-terminal cleavage/methylation domain-containing protein [Actinobacteria bacterium]|nr:prepilin-type N-terminal cleavage/methylation domain-containing protein [Actinomycetota bacterium]